MNSVELVEHYVCMVFSMAIDQQFLMRCNRLSQRKEVNHASYTTDGGSLVVANLTTTNGMSTI